MRYLPTLELDQRINQVAFPDIHAIELAELCLTWPDDKKRDGFERAILSSPMLLFWLHENWKSRLRNDITVPLDADALADQLLSDLSREAHLLVKDHLKPLSSVLRIEAESFVEFQAFFDCRDETHESVSRKMVNRLALLDHVFGELIDSPDSAGNLSGLQSDFEMDRVISEFDRTDFSQFADKENIRQRWMLELPVFRNGLGVLDEKIAKLNGLESEFEELVERGKISAMQQLAYGASHEINNPLANISTRAQALLRDESDPKRRQRLQTIDAQAFRAHDMISNLMTFAKPRRPEIQRFQLKPEVETAVQSLLRMAEEQKVDIQIDCESSVYLEADIEQLREMIFALVENAIESIRNEGVIRIRAHRPESNQPVRVEVMDSGPGIPSEIRKHIFDPFFSGREAGRGLGFGLSKVWRLMELHKGSIRMREKNGFTIFELLFPAEQNSALRIDVEKTA